jgi:ABC-type Fe3+-citrate transport system substrate-binding protein
MATLNEIEARIQDHEKRLIELKDDIANNQERILVTTSLIEFWQNQKKKAMRIEHRLKSKL